MNIPLARALIRNVSLPEPVVDIEFLDKGYSPDRKYLLRTRGDTAYLLRISDIAEESVRRTNFELLSRLRETGVACPQPICFETHPEQGVCFMILAYLPGDCAEEALPKMTLAQQRAVGHQAGEELARIHRALVPENRVDDYAIRGDKYVRHQKFIQEAGLSFRGRDRAERYVAANLDLLRNRPTTFRHGDYHPSNLVVQGETLAGVVDFNKCDWGDPIDDFYKIAFFGAPLSPEYARGQITGYFGGEPPDGFWPLYNLYVAMVLPADIFWTQQRYPQHLSVSLKRIELITSTHDFEDGGAPAWWPPAGRNAGSP
jgi:aminoglycoside phosphotransferase (APT) family kinase protein